MPIRIYDIAKKHGIECKEVLAKLNELREKEGLKLPNKLTASSSLDKITAEFLEKYLPAIVESDKPVSAGQIETEKPPEQLQTTAATTDVKIQDSTAQQLQKDGGVSVLEAPEEVVPAQESSLSSGTIAVVQEPPAVQQTTQAQQVAEVHQPATVSTTAVTEPAETIISAEEPQVEPQQVESVAGETSKAVEGLPQISAATEDELKTEPVSVEVGQSKLETAEQLTVDGSVEEQKLETQEAAIQSEIRTLPANQTEGTQVSAGIEQGEQQTTVVGVETKSSEPSQETVVISGNGQVNNSPTAGVVEPPPQPKTPGIGEKIGTIDISKYLKPKDKQKSQKPEKDKQKPAKQQPPQQKQQPKQPVKQEPQKQKPGKGVQPAQAQAKGMPQKPGTPVGQGQQKGQQKQQAQQKPGQQKPAPPKPVVLPPNAPIVIMKPPIVVKDLAEKIGKKPYQVIAELLKRGIFKTVKDTIDDNIAKEIAAVMAGVNLQIGRRGSVQPQIEKKKQQPAPPEEEKLLKPRPPVITIMGHVDHGKTTLLDAIRKSNVVATEAGGITQHIGAYTISVSDYENPKKLRQITFLDTPGHAAFSAMRARGADVTDIVVLVVAANDGVMPQTIEAINHARAANVPIIVAVNKCDHPNAEPGRVRQQLADLGLVPEEWGGDTIFVDISALTRKGVDKLLEMILLKADIMELKANPSCPAEGNVIESSLEQGGPTATVLIKKGTLKVGDYILCGEFYGRVRALIDDMNKRLKEATPSMAVKVLGLNGVPEPGQKFEVVEDEDIARERAEAVKEEKRQQTLQGPPKRITLESLLKSLEESKSKVLKIILKGDTQGSVEAISDALKKIESEKVSLEIIHSAVGSISKTDVELAAASNAIIIGFHTKIDHGVADLAKQNGVQIKLYTIIYELIDEVKKAMAGLLEPIVKEVVIGRADVKKVFELSKGGKVAGCMVSSGKIVRGKARVLRNNGLIYDGVIQSLRIFQEDVNEVRAGMECGIRIEGFNDFEPGDVIESYNIERTLQPID